jgi:uncharacterized phiE125 gp8 family phage protein
MSSILLSPPSIEPLTLADAKAKAYLRVSTSDDDDVIAGLIAAARGTVEAQTRRALITQTWRLVRDCWPAEGQIAVMPVPLQQVSAARIYRQDGSTQTIDSAAFTIDKAAEPAVLAFAPAALPAPGRPIAGIEIDVEVGYGAAASDVPTPLVQAIKLIVAHWYENRGLIAIGSDVVVLPLPVAALIAPYRVLSL